MYLLGLSLFVNLCIPYVTSYVLLAANIDDFKSLAKKFVPDNLAEEILAIASDSNQSEKKTEMSSESVDKTVNDENVSHYRESKPYIKAKDTTKIKLKLNLDDIVDKVKDKIKKELSVISSKNRKKKHSNHSDHKQEHLPTKSHKRERLIDRDLPPKKTYQDNKQPMYLKESKPDENDRHQDDRYKDNQNTEKHRNINQQKRHKQRIQDNRYVAELFIAPSTKYLTKETRPSSLRPKDLSKEEGMPKQLKISKHINTENKNKTKHFYNEENVKTDEKQIAREDNHGKKRHKYVMRPEKHKQRLVNSEGSKYAELNTETTTINIQSVSLSNTRGDINQLFDKIVMTNKNDSYEDYVAPKKDYSYEDKTSTFNFNYSEISTDSSKKYDEKVRSPDHDDKYISKHSSEIVLSNPNHSRQKYSEITTDYTTKHNWNKKKRFDIQRETMNIKKIEREGADKDDNIEPITYPTESGQDNEPIQTYAQQIVKVAHDYDDETKVTATEELKARTESLLFNDDDEEKEFVSHITKDIKLVTNKKAKKSSIAGTNIPKRDFYKISTPDYLGKMPVVAEKYKFDEPIPEEDREQEALKPIPKPPSRINGKLRVD